MYIRSARVDQALQMACSYVYFFAGIRLFIKEYQK
jgi:hypothetical protein